jgi:ribonuclease-3
MSVRLQKRLSYEFRQPELLAAALTHPSRQMGQKKISEYERLEFLGDRVLALVIAEWLYENFPQESEGSLAKRHAALVNRDALAEIAEHWELEKDLQLVNPDDLQRGRVNILSDAVEAMIGAVYRDAGDEGLAAARAIIHAFWKDMLDGAATAPQDAKSALQEWAQGKGLALPHYELITSSGPAHAPHYVMRVSVEGKAHAEAEGSSKREAEKKAAALLLEKIRSS